MRHLCHSLKLEVKNLFKWSPIIWKDDHFLFELFETLKFKMSNARHSWRSFKLGIENLFKWAPVIWKDRDWDQYFLYEILRFKISNMEQFFRKHGHHVGAEKDANNMSMCVEALHRIMEEDYNKEAFMEHDKKWGKASWRTIDSEKKGSNFKQLLIERPNVKTKEDEEQERKEYRYCLAEEERLIKQDVDYLFDMLKKHVRGWWD